MPPKKKQAVEKKEDPKEDKKEEIKEDNKSKESKQEEVKEKQTELPLPLQTNSNTNSVSNGKLEIANKETEKSDSDSDDSKKRKHKKEEKSERGKKPKSSRGTSTTSNSNSNSNSSDDEDDENEFEGWSSDEIIGHWLLNPPVSSETFPQSDKRSNQAFQGASYGKGQWKFRDAGTSSWKNHDNYTNAVFEYNYRRGVRHFWITLNGIKYEVSLDHRSQREDKDHTKRFVLARD